MKTQATTDFERRQWARDLDIEKAKTENAVEERAYLKWVARQRGWVFMVALALLDDYKYYPRNRYNGGVGCPQVAPDMRYHGDTLYAEYNRSKIDHL